MDDYEMDLKTTLITDEQEKIPVSSVGDI